MVQEHHCRPNAAAESPTSRFRRLPENVIYNATSTTEASKRVVTLKDMPTVFEAGNDELKLLREDPTLARLDAYFRARIREWPYSLKHMECFTVGVFFDLGTAFQNADACELLDTAARLPWDDLHDQAFLLGVELLLELASASGTTEMPQSLTNAWDRIEGRVNALDANYLAWDSLARHYGRQA